MSASQGSSDESIGRPKQWREGRYEQPGKPVDQSVKKPPRADDAAHDTVSTPVTQEDYKS
jgi:hypothetical protein